MESRLYHDGSRELQEHFDTRRIADRLESVTLRSEFTDADRGLIERAPMFFLATVDPDGRPDVSYKGGLPGFVRVVGPSELAFPNYDGNGMYKSLGNARINPEVALLFLEFGAKPRRLRVHGRAAVRLEDALLPEFEGAQLIVRVHAERIFPNCPRYLHNLELVDYSVYAPATGHQPPIPDWKRREIYRDALPERDKQALATDEQA